jgi:hypothetical protein
VLSFLLLLLLFSATFWRWDHRFYRAVYFTEVKPCSSWIWFSREASYDP